MPQIHFCIGFLLKKSTQPLRIPSTSLLQLIAAIRSTFCFLTFHYINQKIVVINPSYKNPFPTDRQYYAYKVPVISKISNRNVLVLHHTKYLLCLDLTLWPPALHPLVQGAVYVVLLAIVVVCHCKVSMTFVLK